MVTSDCRLLSLVVVSVSLLHCFRTFDCSTLAFDCSAQSKYAQFPTLAERLLTMPKPEDPLSVQGTGSGQGGNGVNMPSLRVFSSRNHVRYHGDNLRRLHGQEHHPPHISDLVLNDSDYFQRVCGSGSDLRTRERADFVTSSTRYMPARSIRSFMREREVSDLDTNSRLGPSSPRRQIYGSGSNFRLLERADIVTSSTGYMPSSLIRSFTGERELSDLDTHSILGPSSPRRQIRRAFSVNSDEWTNADGSAHSDNTSGNPQSAVASAGSVSADFPQPDHQPAAGATGGVVAGSPEEASLLPTWPWSLESNEETASLQFQPLPQLQSVCEGDGEKMEAVDGSEGQDEMFAEEEEVEIELQPQTRQAIAVSSGRSTQLRRRSV